MSARQKALEAWRKKSSKAVTQQRTQINQMSNQVRGLVTDLPTGNIKIELGTPEHLGKVLATANVLLSSIDKSLKGKFKNQ